ncbi:complement component 1 Q subcomponent-binding protein, mitochondrial [Rhinatrema bivittatum]|uniref:complement component 1 Q subcomponent-binding protein, mitochondrial n=1 Tax=Rhinatrema bivittatum TaxID=194408 RepID=UPI00112A3A39|nr:complement component 1 Q subcomponent-binding protein, mitochondrial [Rhinatrema bivittatum]
MLSSLSRTLGHALRLTTVRPLEQLLQPALGAGSSAAVRPFSRGIWMPSGGSGSSSSSAVKRPIFLHCSPSFSACGCGALHTEGDKAFSEFLIDEIKEEKKIQKDKSLPKMSGGWELEVHGTEAKLIKKVAGEKITVTFNTNNSIPPSLEEETQEGQKAEENEPELVSTPNFVVEITKQDTKQTLVFDCHYPEDEVGHGEEESDIFSIREVSFQPTGESDWKDTSYNLNTDSLDWALYDHLMDFLADRGVDNTFADELVELSTALEHQEYIQFLEDLKKFVTCQ